MNDFTASNGVHIVLDQAAGNTVVRVSKGGLVEEVFGTPRVAALREFFRAEEDERLGRWRWPDNPDYVVYPVGFGKVNVVRESSVTPGNPGPGLEQGITREEASTWNKAAARHFFEAARAFFDAHPEPEPEPKPWHDAKPGEVWVVEARPRAVVARAHGEPPTFADPFGRNPGFPVTSPEIRTATRLWPEATP